MFKILIMMMLMTFFLKFFKLMFFMSLIYLIFMIMMYPSIYLINFNNFMFLDNLNYLLILLTLWIFLLMLLSMNMIQFTYNNKFLLIVVMMILLFSLVLSFLIYNYLYFYILFEISLIPTLYLILGWGYQPERIMAGLYLLFYTMFASLPLLLNILYLNYKFNLLMMEISDFYLINNLNYYGLMMAFLFKMPMFMVHLWLPKAHVEAPIMGSMILAALLLKLGAYGMIRVMMMLMKFKNLNLFLMIFSLIGGILISMNCMFQLDMKMLIAYSSVAHMSMVISGLMTLNFMGMNGAYLMLIAHGLCSSGLFCLVNFSYERTFSRSLLLNKGLMNFLTSMTLWWFLLLSSNMSAPFSLNLISEILLIFSINSICKLNMILLMFLCFFSALYSYYIYSYSQHGKFYSLIYSFIFNNQREYILMLLHWLPLNIFFLNLFILI
uniref:NADH-ubiquinone oxidoreductase chain 4 n=1 Tax=Asphondylia rosetta TaxID=420168 RepID=C7FIM4_9DIPT|nr:NADH dehydrogenase subunit 4 [Asphondylia rosetta]